MSNSVIRWDETKAVMSLRADRPDGTTVEIVHETCGRVTTTRTRNDGRVVRKTFAELQPQGIVVVTRSEASGEVREVSPDSTTQKMNVYGTTVEHAQYEGLDTERVFNDDGRLLSVSMSGNWGEQTLELGADGSRTSGWETPLHRGTETWDAGGVRSGYELLCSDGTSCRWVFLDDVARETVVGWDGRTDVFEHGRSDVTE